MIQLIAPLIHLFVFGIFQSTVSLNLLKRILKTTFLKSFICILNYYVKRYYGYFGNQLNHLLVPTRKQKHISDPLLGILWFSEELQ